MRESKAATVRGGLQCLGAVFYYLLYCPLRHPQLSVDFLKSVYFYQKTDKLRRLGSAEIPTIPTEQLFPGLFQQPVQLLELGGKWPTGVSLFESYVLASIVRLLQPRTLFEFGTFEGITTLQLALNSPDDAVLYTLDLPENIGSTRYSLSFPGESLTRTGPVGGVFRPYPVSARIRQLYGDSATADFQNLRSKVDFVFVDGDHGYNYVRSDTQNAFSMLSSRGVILWHDYGSKWKDVTLFLRELAKEQGKKIYHLQGTNLAIHSMEDAHMGIRQP